MKGHAAVLAGFMMLAGGVAAAAAQDAAPNHDVLFYRAEQVEPGAGAAVMFEQPIGMIAVEPFETGQALTGAPYSADIVTEIVQTLADGNRIERRSTSSVARDSQGRVRRVQQLAAIGPMLPQGGTQIVTITDPVAGMHFSLDPVRKVAMRSPLAGAGTRLEIGSAPSPPPPPPGAQARARRLIARAERASIGETRTEPLGTRSIEGVTAQGTRTVVTIPAGAIGNIAPIEVVSERWYSPELQTVVMTRRSDPRFGDTIFRLENIVRAEPSPDLFHVPPDYRIEAMRPFPGAFRRQGSRLP